MWEILPAAGREATIVLEAFADDLVTEAEYGAAWGAANDAADEIATPPTGVAELALESAMIWNPPTPGTVRFAMTSALIASGMYAAAQPGVEDTEDAYAANWRAGVIERGALVRDIFGSSPDRVAFHPSWRTEAVVGLARGMYESRDFGPMPVLADALEEAGCAAPDILGHCRGAGPHVRGCWVVDLVLGKE